MEHLSDNIPPDDPSAQAHSRLWILKQAALSHAQRGWRVFPVHTPRFSGCACGRTAGVCAQLGTPGHEPLKVWCSCPKDIRCQNIGKHPRTKNGLKDATTDADIIDAWWSQWPDANIGLVTGKGSGFIALDIDPYHAGDVTLEDLEAQHGKLPDTVEQHTGSGGRHRLLNHPGGLVRNDAGRRLGAGLDVRGDGGYIVAAPSVHASGRNYVWEATSGPENIPLADVPGWLLTLIQAPITTSNGRPEDAGAHISEGQRNASLASLAGSMRRRGMTPKEIYAALAVVNAERCSPPLPDDEIQRIAESIGRYAPGSANGSASGQAGPELGQAPPEKPPQGTGRATLPDVVQIFQRWLYLPSVDALYVLLGTVAANLLPGDPVWLMLVGSPGSGKTELVLSTLGLPRAYPVGTITEGALLSGSSRKDKAKDANGGLLQAIGRFGFLICKDFGSVLSMHREARAAVLAALRELFDGAWVRHVGIDGGRTLSWTGKLAMIAACTPAIDSYHAVMASLGERFLLYRFPSNEQVRQARQALSITGQETAMRKELADAVAGLFTDFRIPDTPYMLTPDEETRLVELATLIVTARSAVERDSYKMEIQLIPDPEMPARMAKTLLQLLAGMTTIGLARDDAWRCLAKVAFACLPALRRAIFDVLIEQETMLKTGDIAAMVKYPTQTTRRALEDLTAHNIVARQPGGEGKADFWGISDWAHERYQSAKGNLSGKVGQHTL